MGEASPPPLQRAQLADLARHEIRFSQWADHPRLVRTIETLVVEGPDQPSVHGAVVLVMERAASSLRDLIDATPRRAGCPPETICRWSREATNGRCDATEWACASTASSPP